MRGWQDVLYIILIARGSVITLIRPRKHSIHPAGMYVFMQEAHLILKSSRLAHITKHNPFAFNSELSRFCFMDSRLSP